MMVTLATWSILSNQALSSHLFFFSLLFCFSLCRSLQLSKGQTVCAAAIRSWSAPVTAPPTHRIPRNLCSDEEARW
jgi:hypothetical protein